jgi:hypothetical protein
MKRTYLEVTFQKGKPLAAYLHLPRANDAKAARSEVREHGMVVDFMADGAPFGVEITAPALVELGALNDLLRDLHVHKVGPADLAPLRVT